MPQMGVSVAEGTIVEWRKQPGDWVEADETICEISTDKIDTEIPSPASGRLVEILVEENETVAVGTPLARARHRRAAGRAARGGEATAAADGSNGTAPSAPDRSHVDLSGRAADRGRARRRPDQGDGHGRRRARPKEGRARIHRGRRRSDATPSAVLHTSRHTGREPSRATANGRAPSGEPRSRSAMRRQIAEHMVRSRHTAAHVTTVAEVDMSRVVARRAALKERFAGRGVPLTYLAFVARATVAALQEQPVLNASIEGDELVYHDDVNLGIAVALETA